MQWVPSKELLDRSPRAGGLSWAELTYGSWSPELLPTLVIREAYGTRARDTDWMDGYYPYHEMNTYMGLIAIVLAVVGAGGRGRATAGRASGSLLIGIGCGADAGQVHLSCSTMPIGCRFWGARANRCGSMCGCRWAWPRWRPSGVERLGRPGVVSLRSGLILAGVLVALSIPDHDLHLCPGLDPAEAWDEPYHLDRYRWLGRELRVAALADSAAGRGWPGGSRRGPRDALDPVRRARWAAILPLLVLADLLSAHWVDVPTVDPAYWTEPPESARRLKANPNTVRIFGMATRRPASLVRLGEARLHASPRPAGLEPAPVWHVNSSNGLTPMISRRLVDFGEQTPGKIRFDLEGDTHLSRVTRPNAAFAALPNLRGGLSVHVPQ